MRGILRCLRLVCILLALEEERHSAIRGGPPLLVMPMRRSSVSSLEIVGWGYRGVRLEYGLSYVGGRTMLENPLRGMWLGELSEVREMPLDRGRGRGWVLPGVVG